MLSVLGLLVLAGHTQRDFPRAVFRIGPNQNRILDLVLAIEFPLNHVLEFTLLPEKQFVKVRSGNNLARSFSLRNGL